MQAKTYKLFIDFEAIASNAAYATKNKGKLFDFPFAVSVGFKHEANEFAECYVYDFKHSHAKGNFFVRDNWFENHIMTFAKKYIDPDIQPNQLEFVVWAKNLETQCLKRTIFKHNKIEDLQQNVFSLKSLDKLTILEFGNNWFPKLQQIAITNEHIDKIIKKDVKRNINVLNKVNSGCLASIAGLILYDIAIEKTFSANISEKQIRKELIAYSKSDILKMIKIVNSPKMYMQRAAIIDKNKIEIHKMNGQKNFETRIIEFAMSFEPTMTIANLIATLQKNIVEKSGKIIAMRKKLESGEVFKEKP